MPYVSTDPRLKSLVVTLAILVLIAYGATFASVVYNYYCPGLTYLPITELGEGLAHIWTSVSVLVGSVVAVALGQPEPKFGLKGLVGWFERNLIILYAWGWLAVGVTACAVWAFANPAYAEVFPLLVKNAASTFLGLVIPVVATLFRELQGKSDGGEKAALRGPKADADLIIGEPADTTAARLTFDGYQLTWHANPSTSWTGFSGPETEDALESVKDIGPTPQGHFTVDPKTIETFEPTDDWGSHRVKLQPLAATVDRMKDCFKLIRSGLYIHGGNVTGTRGCIEINDDQEEEDFFAKLKAYGKPIDLEVKFTGERESKYEDSRCPY